MATHSSVLAWRIPGTGEPGGLPSIGSHRVGHNWRSLAAPAEHIGVMITLIPLGLVCEGLMSQQGVGIPTEPLRIHTEPFRSTCPEPGSALGKVRERRGGLERTEALPLPGNCSPAEQ